MTVCPSGWRLPSNADWDKLFHYVDGTSGTQPGTESPYQSPTAGRYLRATNGWNMCGNGSSYTYKCEDTFGFSALPGSRAECDNSELYFGSSVGEKGYWWSSSECIGTEIKCADSEAYGIRMGYNDEKINYIGSFIRDLLSVRCVKN